MVIRSRDVIGPITFGFRRERFTVVPRRGGKGDKSVIPLARSRRWAVFIAIFICHGEEANGIFLYSVYWCAKTKV